MPPGFHRERAFHFQLPDKDIAGAVFLGAIIFAEFFIKI